MTEPRTSPTFVRVALRTGPDGRAAFHDEPIALPEGTPASRLSESMSVRALQLRESPVGFQSSVHCTTTPQWVFILQGVMEIGLPGGESRCFGPGQHFYSADILPPGEVFDPSRHGHWSRQVGDVPLVTVFVRD